MPLSCPLREMAPKKPKRPAPGLAGTLGVGTNEKAGPVRRRPAEIRCVSFPSTGRRGRFLPHPVGQDAVATGALGARARRLINTRDTSFTISVPGFGAFCNCLNRRRLEEPVPALLALWGDYGQSQCQHAVTPVRSGCVGGSCRGNSAARPILPDQLSGDT